MPKEKTIARWLPLVGLTFAVFVFNTSEFMPIGLLSDIAADLHISEVRAGLLVSVYAWVVALMSLPLMVMVSTVELKRLLLAIIALFVVSHVASALAEGYYTLMLSRIGVACAHAVFWSVISPIAVRIVPDRYRSIALSMVVTGSSIAMILGMPLGRVIGLHVGWRMTFFSIGVFSALTFLYIAWRLPKVPSGGGFSPKKLPELLRHKGIMGLYLFTLLISSAIYVAYSYIEPFLKQVSLMPDDWVTTALMVFGGAGLLGSIAFSKYYNRNRKLFITVNVAAMALCLLLLYPVSSGFLPIIVLLAVWGATATAYNVAMQSNMILVTTPESTPVAMSIFSGIFNLGIGSGAFFGGAICSDLSISYIGLAGGVFALIGLVYWVARLGNRIEPKDTLDKYL